MDWIKISEKLPGDSYLVLGYYPNDIDIFKVLWYGFYVTEIYGRRWHEYRNNISSSPVDTPDYWVKLEDILPETKKVVSKVSRFELMDIN